MSILPQQLLPLCRRRDHVMAAYVNAAAAMRTRLGGGKIERFLLDAGVPEPIVLRVSAAGGPRRPWARVHEFADRAGLGDSGSAASAVYFRASAVNGWGVNRRVNGRIALLVDAAINAAASHGITGAATELIDWGFSVEFAFRVLGNPGARRRYAGVAAPVEREAAPGQRRVCRRRNRLQAAYVDAALRISRVVSVQRAEAILLEQSLPQRVIDRVLYLNGLLRKRSIGADAYAGDNI